MAALWNEILIDFRALVAAPFKKAPAKTGIRTPSRAWPALATAKIGLSPSACDTLIHSVLIRVAALKRLATGRENR